MRCWLMRKQHQPKPGSTSPGSPLTKWPTCGLAIWSLWSGIGEASGKPIPAIMHGWVYQPGYPLISANNSGSPSKIEVKQQRFYLDPPREPDDKTWDVPLGIRSLDEQSSDQKLLDKTQ